MTVRLTRFVESVYYFFGLYFSSLFAVRCLTCAIYVSYPYLTSPSPSFSLHPLRTLFAQSSHWINLTSRQLDSYAAAERSSFNINNSTNRYTTRSRWGTSSSSGGGGGGGGGGGSGPGTGPRRLGRVDDVRGPECGSCR
jgi:uncharacterized membrane protein YgcG